MVELELLAVRWALKKCHNFLFGLNNFTLVVDHLPLVSILDKQTLDCNENARIQRLKAATSPYTFTTVWKKGREHRIPDALSRAPVQEPTPDYLVEEKELYIYVCSLQKTTAIAIERETEGLEDDSLADTILEEIRSVGSKDPEYKGVIKMLSNDHKDPINELKHFTKNLPEMSIVEGLVLFRQRLLIPRPLRKELVRPYSGRD